MTHRTGGPRTHRRIDTTLRQLRQDPCQYLDRSVVARICCAAGHVWRDGVLTPFATLHWFLLQVLSGNTARSMWPRWPRRLSPIRRTVRRVRAPLGGRSALLRHLITAFVPDTHDHLWYGHCTFLLDGSSFSMPDTPELQRSFGQPGAQQPGCGFPSPRSWLCSTRHGAAARSDGRPLVFMGWRVLRTSIPPCSQATSWWPTAASARSRI